MLNQIISFLVITFSGLTAFANVTAVMVVRHAETSKANPGDRDPGLSDKGEERAHLLKQISEQLDVQAVFASEYKRTQLTVTPSADRLGQEVQVVGARQPHDLADKIRQDFSGEMSLVAGHSNTVPWIVDALGGGIIGNLDHNDYTTFYIVLVGADVEDKSEEIKSQLPGVEEVENVVSFVNDMKLLRGGYGQDLN